MNDGDPTSALRPAASTDHAALSTFTWLALLALLALSYALGTRTTATGEPSMMAETQTLLWATAFTKLSLIALVFMELGLCRWYWRAAALGVFLVCVTLIAVLLPG